MERRHREKRVRYENSYGAFHAIPGGGEGNRCLYPERLDTYGRGGQHNCAYCYARSLLDFRGLWNPDNPAVADVADMMGALQGIERGSVVRLGGMTDCFQPIERKFQATYQLIKMLNARGIHYLIVTKSDLVADSLYLKTFDKELAHIQITITSTDDTPNQLKEVAPAPSRRIAAAEKLQALGFDVAVRVSPYIPELVDMKKLNGIKVDKCLVEFLRVNHFIEQWLDMDTSEYTLKSGGYRHLPLDRKVELLGKFMFKQLSVCEDVPEHYEYFKHYVNHNMDDCCNLRGQDATKA